MRRSGTCRLVGTAVVVVAGGVGLAGCYLAPLTTTSLSSNSLQTLAGQVVVLSASVSARPPAVGQPDGSVAFTDGQVPLGNVALSGGMAVLSTAVLSPGSHDIVATYSGSASWSGSASNTETITVQRASTSYYISMGDSLATGGGASAGHGYVDQIFGYEATRVPGLVAVKLGCGGATTGLAWSWARAVVASKRSMSATASSTVSNSSTWSMM